MDAPLLSLNVTLPVGIALLPFATVAWKVKIVPNGAFGLGVELPGLNVVVVSVGLIVMESVLLVAARLLVSVG